LLVAQKKIFASSRLLFSNLSSHPATQRRPAMSFDVLPLDDDFDSSPVLGEDELGGYHPDYWSNETLHRFSVEQESSKKGHHSAGGGTQNSDQTRFLGSSDCDNSVKFQTSIEFPFLSLHLKCL
jgi:hypothetical protein